MRADDEMVTSNDDAKVKKANDVEERKKPMTDDIAVSNGTKERYVRDKSSTGSPVVTIGGKYSTYKISNNFCTN